MREFAGRELAEISCSVPNFGIVAILTAVAWFRPRGRFSRRSKRARRHCLGAESKPRQEIRISVQYSDVQKVSGGELNWGQ